MNTDIRKEMNKRYKLLKNAQKHPRSSELWTEYRKQRHCVTFLKRKTEDEFWKNKLENTKKIQGVLENSKAHQRKTNQLKIGPIQGVNKEIITDDLKKAEHINDYFSTDGEMLVKNIVRTDDFTQMEHFYRITPKIDSISVDPEKVVQSLQERVKAAKGCGPDCINSTDLSIIGNSASTGLSVIIQNSISHNKYPSQWKTSRVRSVFKKGSKLLPENYRPIALLSIPSKIYEDFICKEIDKHAYTHDLSSKHQWGFKKKHSTELLMLKLTGRWKQELGSGNVV